MERCHSFCIPSSMEEAGRKEEGTAPAPKQAKKAPPFKDTRTLLVVGGKPSIDWYALFNGATIHEDRVKIIVEMAAWDGARFLSSFYARLAPFSPFLISRIVAVSVFFFPI